MFDTVCTLPLTSDLFAQAIHPSEPIVSVGLAGGHVQTYRLPPVAFDGSSGGDVTAPENGFGTIDTIWRTRRHKGSCRTLAFSVDGSQLYSAGTDGLVKAADSMTGQVVSKIAIPHDATTNKSDAPALLHGLSPQTLLLATDSSALHIYDIRAPHSQLASRPSQTHHPHDDYIASLTPLPPSAASTSGFSKQWVTTGGTTLAVTDLRRGVLVRSEDQEEEMLSSVFVGGMTARGTSKGEKILVGGGSGVLTLWERGQWDDQDERIIVDRNPKGGESLDVLTAVPEGIGAWGKIVAVGQGDGLVRFVRIGQNKVIAQLRHDGEYEDQDHPGEPVVGLGFDVGGRMISGGGTKLKVWHEKVANEDEAEEAEGNGVSKRELSDDSDEEDEEDEDSSDDERKRRKRKKQNKGKDRIGNHGIMATFSGLD
ncbi:WD repeat-containing protein JIP5 [Lophium mytilinum]|uniref:WD repeat-containing protein JIP5 n=1 Tax=Lophium mytilinum TaxID=390894 RepID=A0A6A6RBN5_9PEZI|nr:WD repeat-containing protein JIP5 [Lophium mytilinum]